MVTHRRDGDRRRGRGEPERGVFDAIADPTRRAILDGLTAGPRKAGEIASDFAISRPGVTKHLRALESAGLVGVRKEGRVRFYELTPGPLREVERWLERNRAMWAARLVSIKRVAESDGDTAGGAGHGTERSDEPDAG